ncbi:hypothetical protein AAG570_009807 [Ranatra chinensis]|uniref:Uncharacterized protein n=1 Tax=Ranatra chinensis TaxID=642074 RepID=A0ABD0YQF6_9HEMI
MASKRRNMFHKNKTQETTEKEKLLRMQEESVNLEILHRSTLEKAEKNWLAEVTKRDQEIANLRQIFSENEANLMNKFMIEKQGLEKMVADIENARNNEKIEAERVLSRTISLYEEKLMKMNEDLASSQTEMRNLRQRLASLKYSQENKMGSLKPGEDCLQVPPNLSQGQLPVPVQQLTPRLANGPYASAPQVNSLPHYNYYDVLSAMGTHESAYKGHQPVQSSPVHQVVNGQRTVKVSFPVAKKRKLYSKSNEML